MLPLAEVHDDPLLLASILKDYSLAGNCINIGKPCRQNETVITYGELKRIRTGYNFELDAQNGIGTISLFNDIFNDYLNYISLLLLPDDLLADRNRLILNSLSEKPGWSEKIYCSIQETSEVLVVPAGAFPVYRKIRILNEYIRDTPETDAAKKTNYTVDFWFGAGKGLLKIEYTVPGKEPRLLCNVR